MSASASLNINFDSNTNISSIDIIKALKCAGWRIDINNRITYLPLDDDDMFDWTSKELLKESLFDIMSCPTNGLFEP